MPETVVVVLGSIFRLAYRPIALNVSVDLSWATSLYAARMSSSA